MNTFMISLFVAGGSAVIASVPLVITGWQGYAPTIYLLSVIIISFVLSLRLYPKYDRHRTARQVAKDKICMEQYKKALKEIDDSFEDKSKVI